MLIHICLLLKYALIKYKEIALLLLSITNCGKHRFLKSKYDITGDKKSGLGC